MTNRLSVVLAAAACLVACSKQPTAASGNHCVPGVVAGCTCADGSVGSRACRPGGNWEVCDCSAVEPGAVPDPTGAADYWLDFGARAIAERADATLPLRAGGARLELHEDAVDAPFHAETPAVVLAPGESGLLAWSFVPTAAGTFETVTRVTSANDSFTVRLTGEGFEPEITCDTTTIDFGGGVVGRERHRQVICRDASPHPWEPVAGPIQGEDRTAFRAALTRQAPGEYLLDVAVIPERIGTLAAYVALQDGAGNAVLRVRLMAYSLANALVCEPSFIDFGFVAPDMAQHAQVVCSNLAADAYQLTGLALAPSSSPSFAWSPNEYPIVIPAAVGDVPGATTIDVVFLPRHEDLASRRNGILVLETNDDTIPRIDIPMTGFAGGPVLSCSPAEVDFGIVATGLPVTRTIVCANTGTDDPTRTDDLLVVSGLQSTGSPDITAVNPNGPFAAGYPVGATFSFDVTYNPVDDGVDTASIQVLSNAINGGAAVAVSGVGHDFPPCDFQLVPAPLRFGIVDKGDSATLEFAIRNHRADAECLIRNLRLAPGCSSAFSLPEGEVQLDVLPPSGERRYPVQFSPRAYQTTAFTCDVLFDISNPNTPHQVLPVRGASQEPCALIMPTDLDFGTVKPGCATRDREFQIINTCSRPLVLDGIVLNAGVSDEFVIRSTPPAGYSIPAGLGAAFTVSYRPQDEGRDTGSVFVNVQGTAEPYLATMRGRAALDGVQTDSFEQNDRPKVDVLVVMDNSGGMAEKQIAVASNLRPFLSFAQAQEIDYQIGVTTSGLTAPCGNPGGAGGAEDGRLFPVDNSRPRILTPNTPNLETVWRNNIQVGTCHFDEQEMEAAYRALHPPVIDHCDDPRHPELNDGNCGFLRPEAHLSIVAVTDEADQSPMNVAYYYNAFLALKGFRNPHLFSFHAVTGDPVTGCTRVGGGAEAGDRLAALAAMTEGGLFRSICTNDWATTMTDLSQAVFGFETCFFLGNQPEDTNGNGTVSDIEGEMEVRLNGLSTPSTDVGTPVWTFRGDRNAVCFAPRAVPEPGTQIDISYRVACLAW